MPKTKHTFTCFGVWERQTKDVFVEEIAGSSQISEHRAACVARGAQSVDQVVTLLSDTGRSDLRVHQ